MNQPRVEHPNPCAELFKPAWAISYSDKPVLGSHLATKDGRLTGNAHIIDVYPANWNKAVTLYTVLTDAGNTFICTDRELDDLFHPPQWVSDVQDVIKRFKRPE